MDAAVFVRLSRAGLALQPPMRGLPAPRLFPQDSVAMVQFKLLRPVTMEEVFPEMAAAAPALFSLAGLAQELLLDASEQQVAGMQMWRQENNVMMDSTSPTMVAVLLA